VPTPKWRHKARLGWSPIKEATVSVQWRHSSAMGLATKFIQPIVSPLDERLPKADFFDLSSLFNITRDYALRLGVNNIFDKEPPRVVDGEGACALGCNGNTYPQWYDPLGRYFFAGVTIKLKPY
ncbi:MAG TPA: TonB-dependent receptor, partial [Sphingomicrobium sp.]|nr:TonB-dependent receptor [Sphingomicrobium sp.]